MALLSEWMQKCGKNVLDNAGIVRDACLRKESSFAIVFLWSSDEYHSYSQSPAWAFRQLHLGGCQAGWNRHHLLAGHRCSGYRVCQNRHSNSFSVVWTLLLDVFSALVRLPTTQA